MEFLRSEDIWWRLYFYFRLIGLTIGIIQEWIVKILVILMLLFCLDEFRFQLKESIFELLSFLDAHLEQVFSLPVLFYFLVIVFSLVITYFWVFELSL